MKQILGLLAISAALCFAAPAKADRLDTLNTYDVRAYCDVTTRFFNGGADGNKTGHARKISQVRPEFYEYLEHHVPLPKNSMWVTEWDSLSKVEQAFMEGITFEGWDAYEEFKKHNVDPDVELMTQTYFEGCLEKRTKEQVSPKTKIDFHKTASSQTIAKNIREDLCSNIKSDIYTIAEEVVMNRYNSEELKKFAAEAFKDTEPIRFFRIEKQIDDAFVYGTERIEEWIAKELKACE